MAGANDWIPQFPDGSGWNLEDYSEAPYYYEHVTRKEARELRAACAERIYKIVCIHPFGRYYHKNTYFVKWAFVAEFLERPIFTAIAPQVIISIEPVESMPPTDERLPPG